MQSSTIIHHGFELNYSTIEQLLGYYEHSIERIQNFDNQTLWNYYLYSLRFRHDLVHYLLCLSVFGIWKPEKIISDIYPNYDGDGSNLTPDLILEYKGEIFVIDVAVTTDIHSTILRKEQRYQPLCNGLSVFLNKRVYFKAFVFSMAGSSFQHTFSNIKPLLKYPFNDHLMYRGFELFDKQIEITNKCDKAFLRQMKEEYYGETFRTGLIKDTKISEEKMDEIIKKKYPIDVNYPDMNFEEEWFKLDSGIKNKYKDVENDSKQYSEAYQEIQEMNQKLLKNQKIKPTNYILYPDVEILEKKHGEYSEQKMIIAFFKYLIDNKPEIINEDEDFLFDYSKVFLDIMSKKTLL